VQDKAGNLYGTTAFGAVANNGTVFELSPNADGSWTFSTVYEFTGKSDGGFPLGQIAIDSAGNIYGTAGAGGFYGYGTVYKLSPSGGGWVLTTLYNFTSDFGNNPNQEGVALDSAGNLYGITRFDGEYQLGTVYELTPTVGFWNQTIVHTFTGNNDGAYPFGGLTVDQAGAVYGTTDIGGIRGQGTVYKLVRGKSGQWNAHALHSFGGADGEEAVNGVIIDSSGNLYGVASAGGAYGFGVAFEIVP